MSTRKHRKLKRHPIVRFIRGIFRLFRVLFRPQRTARLELPRPVVIIEPSFDDSFDRDRLVTVGELFGSIKWQSPPPKIQTEFTGNSKVSRPQDLSRN